MVIKIQLEVCLHTGCNVYTFTPAQKRRVWFRDCVGEALDEKWIGVLHTILHSHSQSHGLHISTSFSPKSKRSVYTAHLIWRKRRLHSGYPTLEIPCWLFRPRRVYLLLSVCVLSTNLRTVVPWDTDGSTSPVSTFCCCAIFRIISVVWRLAWSRALLFRRPAPCGCDRSHWAPCLRCTPGWFPIILSVEYLDGPLAQFMLTVLTAWRWRILDTRGSSRWLNSRRLS